MKAIVHIGTEKTGTTTIQEFLFLNRKKLAKKGFHVLQGEGHHNNREVVAYCMNDDKFDDFFKQRGIHTPEQKAEFKHSFYTSFRDELEKLPRKIHSVIISSEHFHSRTNTRAETDRIRDFLASFFDDIDIVCYLRDQVPMLASFYSTAIKSGTHESFESFTRHCTAGNIYFNHERMLSNWEASFGREAMHLGLFDRRRFLNGNLLDDFVSRIDSGLAGKLNTSVATQNESLNFTGQLLGRTINKILPVYNEDGSVNELRPWCQQVIYDECKGSGQQPDPDTRSRIHQDFFISNEAVRKTYFPHLEALFPSPCLDENVNELNEVQFANVLATVLPLLEQHGCSVQASTLEHCNTA